MAEIKGWNTPRVQQRYKSLKRLDKKRLLRMISGVTATDMTTPKGDLIFMILEDEFGIEKDVSLTELRGLLK